VHPNPCLTLQSDHFLKSAQKNDTRFGVLSRCARSLALAVSLRSRSRSARALALSLAPVTSLEFDHFRGGGGEERKKRRKQREKEGKEGKEEKEEKEEN
jgi:hypothetical protein